MYLHRAGPRASDIPPFQSSWCDMKTELGKGSYGTVYKGHMPGRDGEEGEDVAVKMLDCRKAENPFSEIMTQNRINHPAILKIKAWAPDMDNFRYVIVTEYLPFGDLAKALEAERQSAPIEKSLDGVFVKWSETKKAICAVGVAIGMAAAHKLNTCHRDLKPANVLLDADMYPKICDFGMAKSGYEQDSKQTVTQILTPLYTPPEVFSGDDGYDPEKVDVYSYSMLLYECVTGKKPFHEKGEITVQTLQTAVMKGERPTFDGCSCTDDIMSLIEDCWNQNPTSRPTFEELIGEDNLTILREAFPGLDETEYDDYLERAMDAYNNLE